MNAFPSYQLLPLGGGRAELRVFADGETEPVVLFMEEDDVKRFAEAVDAALQSAPKPVAIAIDGCNVAVTGQADGGLLLRVVR